MEGGAIAAPLPTTVPLTWPRRSRRRDASPAQPHGGTPGQGWRSRWGRLGRNVPGQAGKERQPRAQPPCSALARGLKRGAAGAPSPTLDAKSAQGSARTGFEESAQNLLPPSLSPPFQLPPFPPGCAQPVFPAWLKESWPQPSSPRGWELGGWRGGPLLGMMGVGEKESSESLTGGSPHQPPTTTCRTLGQLDCYNQAAKQGVGLRPYTGDQGSSPKPPHIL